MCCHCVAECDKLDTRFNTFKHARQPLESGQNQDNISDFPQIKQVLFFFTWWDPTAVQNWPKKFLLQSYQLFPCNPVNYRNLECTAQSCCSKSSPALLTPVRCHWGWGRQALLCGAAQEAVCVQMPRHSHPADARLLGSWDCSNSAAGTEIFKVVWWMFGLWQVNTWQRWRPELLWAPLKPSVSPCPHVLSAAASWRPSGTSLHASVQLSALVFSWGSFCVSWAPKATEHQNLFRYWGWAEGPDPAVSHPVPLWLQQPALQKCWMCPLLLWVGLEQIEHTGGNVSQMAPEPDLSLITDVWVCYSSRLSPPPDRGVQPCCADDAGNSDFSREDECWFMPGRSCPELTSGKLLGWSERGLLLATSMPGGRCGVWCPLAHL